MLSTISTGQQESFDWIVTTQPAAEPITAALVAAQLRVTASDDDTRILSYLIPAARSICEAYTNRAFIDQTITYIYDGTPPSVIELPRAPLSSVTSITTYAEDDTATVFATSKYTVDTQVEPGRVFLTQDATWPDGMRTYNSVKIIYVAGYGTAGTDVPSDILQAIILQTAYMYENPLGLDGKEASFVDSARSMTPIHDAQMILNRYKVWNI